MTANNISVTTMEFLRALMPQPLVMGRWVVAIRSKRGGKWTAHWVHSLETVARLGAGRRQANDVFLAPVPQEPKVALKQARSRRARVNLGSVPGAAAAALVLPAVWVRLEVAREGEEDLPPDRASALGLLAAVPMPPSVVVAHGGGFDVYWLLRQPWSLTSADDRLAATQLLARVRSAVVSAAADEGWQLEPGVDLAERLRLPGTLDHRGSTPVPVSVERFPLPGEDRRVDPDDFARLPAPSATPPRLPRRAIAALAKAEPPAAFEPMFDGCGWLRHCYQERAVLPAAEWRVVLGLAGRSQTPEADGRALAHWISQGHPGTTRAVTDDELDQALATPPPTCDRIARRLGAAACESCPHRGAIASPLELGRGQGGAVDDGLESAAAPSNGDEVAASLAGAEIRIYGADGVLLRVWGAAPSMAPGVVATDAAGGETVGSVPVSPQMARADFVVGLGELLADLGGAATARQIVERLAAPASSGRYLRLRAGLAGLDPRWRGGQAGAASLGLLLRRYAGEVVEGVCIERLHKTYLGVVWRAQWQGGAVG